MYVLGTQALADLVSGLEYPVVGWYNKIRHDNRVFVSVVSLGMIDRQIRRLSRDRDTWKRRLKLAGLHFGGLHRLLAVNEPVVRAWAGIDGDDLTMHEGSRAVPLGEDSLLVAATAISRRFTLVEEWSSYIDVLAERHNLKSIDPCR